MVVVSLLLAAGYISAACAVEMAALRHWRARNRHRQGGWRSRRCCCGRCCRSASWSLSSVKPARDIFAVPPRIAFTPTLQHYVDLWPHWGSFFIGLCNSLIVTAGATVLAVTASTLAGYAYSRHRSRAMSPQRPFLVAVRLIPPIVITLPLFPIVNWLRLNDTHLVLIILYATFFVSLGTLLMRTFIDQIPRELDEAARVDGAGRCRRSAGA